MSEEVCICTVTVTDRDGRYIASEDIVDKSSYVVGQRRKHAWERLKAAFPGFYIFSDWTTRKEKKK